MKEDGHTLWQARPLFRLFYRGFLSAYLLHRHRYGLAAPFRSDPGHEIGNLGAFRRWAKGGMAYIRSPFLNICVGVPLRTTLMSVCGLSIANAALPFMAGLTLGMPSPSMPWQLAHDAI